MMKVIRSNSRGRLHSFIELLKTTIPILVAKTTHLIASGEGMHMDRRPS